MPQIFRAAVLTKNGEALAARAAAGEVKIRFTALATGSGEYPREEWTALRERTDLKEYRNTYELSSVGVQDENTVKVTALISNRDPTSDEAVVTEGYYISEIGLYAVPDEEGSEPILFSLAVTEARGDYMPAYNGGNPVQITQSYLAVLSSSGDAVIKVKNDAVALAEDLLKIYEMLNPDLVDAAFLTEFPGLSDDDDGGGDDGIDGDEDAMSEDDIENAIDTVWDGSSSSDPDAMAASDVGEALNTTWNGEASTDPDAMTPQEIDDAIEAGSQ